ncbi:hypothetical protein [Paenibacillus hunanensis]|uniref:Zn-finger nucleic acid-binding protein n=1 Tax=Paenibacillus hunanensis TaxID=539262 RepID=A0ABU1IUL7_9BACL|nr:hypothetical protein [Paenibacillus hunanensis]MCL9661448.1 hypothetical protein [Paenibacillus hunanensis]MDR6242923.1 Zn-finger nucleic acid-binding protein [Paenibacillus hunanensis]WPP41716.1 hypothetical protein SK066_01775 [Paenibacillus hunanensis]GGJ03884.1 hypothetical protein GCM10008022_10980 [Paenibacillus hunanensis]
MGLIKSIIKQVMKSKSHGQHRHRSYSSSDRYRGHKGYSHNQYGHGHYKHHRKKSSYSSS